jgi:flagellar biosynthesis/type III secretory pathway protein FliH
LSKVIPKADRPQVEAANPGAAGTSSAGTSSAGTASIGSASIAAAREGVRDFEPRRISMSRQPAQGPGKTPHGAAMPLLPTSQLGRDAAEVEVAQREAFRQGHQEGERAGEERAAAPYREAVAAFGRSVLQVATLKPRLRAEAERDLVELAFAIARRILRREISVDPTAVVGLIRGCLDQYSRAEISRLQVHPQDLAAVTEFFSHNPAPRLEVVADPKVSRGGAVFETTRGVLDARFETQLEEIEKGLTDR